MCPKVLCIDLYFRGFTVASVWWKKSKAGLLDFLGTKTFLLFSHRYGYKEFSLKDSSSFSELPWHH